MMNAQYGFHTNSEMEHSTHAHATEEFRRRFWISLIITIPILLLSPMLQHRMGVSDSLRFNGELYLLSLSTIVVAVNARLLKVG
jgi:Cu2+-exporting ATPase